MEEESEMVELIEIENDDDDEDEEEEEDDNEIIKVIEVIEDPDDDFIIEEIVYLDNQLDEKSEEEDDGRTILVTIENDDSQLTSFSQDSTCTQDIIESDVPIEMISADVSENTNSQEFININVQDSSQDVEEFKEDVAIEMLQEEIVEESKIETKIDVIEEPKTETIIEEMKESKSETKIEEIEEPKTETIIEAIEESKTETTIEKISIEEKKVTNQYAAAFESLSSEAKLNIFASLISTKTPEKPKDVQMEVDDEIIDEKPNISEGKINLLSILPDNLIIDSKFFESFTHKRVNGEATVINEKLIEISKNLDTLNIKTLAIDKITEKPKLNTNFSEFFSTKNYNSITKSPQIENLQTLEKSKIMYIPSTEKSLITKPIPSKEDESLQSKSELIQLSSPKTLKTPKPLIIEDKPSKYEKLKKVESVEKSELKKSNSSHKKSSKEKTDKEKSSKHKSSQEKSKTKSVETLKQIKYLDTSVSSQNEKRSKYKSRKLNLDKIDVVHTKSPKKSQEISTKDKPSKIKSLQKMETLENNQIVEKINSENLQTAVTVKSDSKTDVETSLKKISELNTLKIEDIDIKSLKISSEIMEIVSECSKKKVEKSNKETGSIVACLEIVEPIKTDVFIPEILKIPLEIPNKKINLKNEILQMETFDKTIENSFIKSVPEDDKTAQNDSLQIVESIQKVDGSSIEDSSKKCKDEEKEGRRRSSRIKIISQSKRRSHGHGLVRDKDRFIKAIEPSTTPSKAAPLSAEEQEKILEHERDMQQRLSKFLTIKENEYYCDRTICKEAKKMTCDCFLTQEEIDAGEFGCGEDCLNRLLMIECGIRCVVGDRCTNRRFQKNLYSNCDVFRTEKKGFGILASTPIRGGEFIMEYVGEVLTRDLFEKRVNDYSKNQNTHFYFMSLRSDAYIDATIKGNISRFINHSCDPNAETQKWTVNGELKIGFFSRRDIAVDEEITFDYEFQNYGKEAQKCYCESANCRGWIGEEPDSDTDYSDESDEEEGDDDEEDVEAILEEVKQFELKNSLLKENENTEKLNEITSEELPVIITDSTETKIPIPVVPKIKVKKPKVKRPKKIRAEIMDDNDLDDEIMNLGRTGVKRKEHILKLSRLMVRAKNIDARCNILSLIREGELPCRRLFLDYQGLRLLYGWLSDSIIKETNANLILITEILETLKTLPIPNKTMTKDSKVYSIVEKWANSKNTTICSPNDDSPSPETNCSPNATNNTNVETSTNTNEQVLAHSSPKTDLAQDELNLLKEKVRNMSIGLFSMWENLKEIFKIPKNMKRERIEQQKEHERQADISYKSLGIVDDETDDSFRYKSRYRNQCYEGKPIESWVHPMSVQARVTNDLRRKVFEQKVMLTITKNLNVFFF